MKFIFPLILFACCHVCADVTIVRTNYYVVGGETTREIRADIRRKCPWKEEVDAYTDWKINWSFRTVPNDSGCLLQSFDIRTEVTITVPRWTAPTNAEPQARASWAAYMKGLLAHEDGHKRIAIAAASEVRKRMARVKSAASCEQLEEALKGEANQVLDDFKRREKLYDERTEHGRKDGAVLQEMWIERDSNEPAKEGIQQ